MPGKKKCGDQKSSGGRKECKADGNQRMSGEEHGEKKKTKKKQSTCVWQALRRRLRHINVTKVVVM